MNDFYISIQTVYEGDKLLGPYEDYDKASEALDDMFYSGTFGEYDESEIDTAIIVEK